jgi:hypothetical protein
MPINDINLVSAIRGVGIGRILAIGQQDIGIEEIGTVFVTADMA